RRLRTRRHPARTAHLFPYTTLFRSGPGSVPGTAPLVEPNDPNAGTLTEGMRDLDGDGIPDEGTESGDEGNTVGQTGSIGGDGNPLENTEDPKAKPPVKEIDAGGDGPMCVN